MDEMLTSRDGSVFPATIDHDHDGSLTILSAHGKGYRSAHRDRARREFPGKLLHTPDRLSWINTHGVRVVLTRWRPV